MKTLNKILILAMMAVVLVSCKKEEEKDYTLKDITPLITTYSGNCTIFTLDFSEKKEKTQSTNVEFLKTNDAKALVLKTDEFGIIIEPLIKNFKTSEDGNYYTFSLDGFNQSWSEAQVPLYIKEWLGGAFKKITSVTAKMQPTNGKYDTVTNTVTFTYDAETTVVGTNAGDESRSQKIIVKYQYAVTKKN